MKLALYVAAFLGFAIGVAHSWLGERYILIRLFRRPDLPKLFGSTEFTTRTLRFAWHITSIAWWGFASLLLLLAHPPINARDVGLVAGVTFIATAVSILAGSRGKHPGWLIFLVMGVLTFYATSA